MSTFDHEYVQDRTWLELAFSVVMRDGWMGQVKVNLACFLNHQKM